MIELTSYDKNIFKLKFYNKHIELTFCELLSLRNKINNINIENHFYSNINKFGLEIISLSNLKYILILS